MAETADKPAGDDLERIEVASVAELREWLADNHSRSASVWLVTHKKSAGPTYVSRNNVLDELVCVGWIDGVRRALDERRTMQLIGPRRTQRWARSYKDRAARLEAEGRMQPAGEAAIERSKELGLWTALSDVDDLIWPDDLRTELEQQPEATSFFAGAAPSYQRNVLRWIALAKAEVTRKRRIEQTVAESAAGRRIRNL